MQKKPLTLSNLPAFALAGSWPKTAFLKKFSPEDMFLMIFREKGREGGGEKEKHNVRKKHRSFASYKCPDWGLNLQPRYVP